MSRLRVYAGLFWIAFATLVFEITLTRLLSVVTWYHLAFFAVGVAMLGMTAGAVWVYLRRDRIADADLCRAAADACLGFTLSVPATLAVLCLVSMHSGPLAVVRMLAVTLASALPFFFAGIAVTLLLTRPPLPIGRLYASDLAGASLGCLGVLAALGWMDAPSLILLAGAIGALAGWCLLAGEPDRRRRTRALIMLLAAVTLALANRSPRIGIRPLYVKGKQEGRGVCLFEAWNSFSRVAVYPGAVEPPQLWGPSPALPAAVAAPIFQYRMNIDGEAGTYLRPFRQTTDVAHLRYDVTSLVHDLRPTGAACVIGVGGARDMQAAILAGHERVLGVELNPVFVRLLNGPFREIAGIARPGVRLVVDEARSYLSRCREPFAVVQMSLIDTWAATGAGAFSFSENALYTVEAWQVFLRRLTDDGIFTVSRWHSPEALGETGRVMSLAVAALYELGVARPRDHLALVSAGNISTLLVRRTPFDDADRQRLQAACADRHFTLLVRPGAPAGHPVLESILSAASTADLRRRVAGLPLNYEPPTDDAPYFFNMLRLRSAFGGRGQQTEGIVVGNLKANAVLLALIGVLAVLAVATVIVPLRLAGGGAARDAAGRRLLRAGGVYFALIGTGFMLLEIALIQRLALYLSHPVYALGILLFSIIAATGLGSLASERIPLTHPPWPRILPLAMAALILAVHAVLGGAIAATIVWSPWMKCVLSVLLIAPLGFGLGLFFPAGMRLARAAGARDTPWFWALNGVFGVLTSAVAVFIAIFLGNAANFYLAAACYLALLGVLPRLAAPTPTAGTRPPACTPSPPPPRDGVARDHA
jgi:hypothetical protein